MHLINKCIYIQETVAEIYLQIEGYKLRITDLELKLQQSTNEISKHQAELDDVRGASSRASSKSGDVAQPANVGSGSLLQTQLPGASQSSNQIDIVTSFKKLTEGQSERRMTTTQFSKVQALEEASKVVDFQDLLTHLNPIEETESMSTEQRIESMNKRLNQITNLLDKFLKQNFTGAQLVRPVQHQIELSASQFEWPAVNLTGSGNRLSSSKQLIILEKPEGGKLKIRVGRRATQTAENKQFNYNVRIDPIIVSDDEEHEQNDSNSKDQHYNLGRTEDSTLKQKNLPKKQTSDKSDDDSTEEDKEAESHPSAGIKERSTKTTEQQSNSM